MSTAFSVIYDEFVEDLDALNAIVEAFSTPGAGSGKTRVAAANSVTLLLAATFEEFVREMARTYARALIVSCKNIDDVPQKFLKHAWTRYVDGFAKMQFETATKRDESLSKAFTRFTAFHEFSSGNLGKDIYKDIIHNENNMRPGQVNNLFSISGISNLCLKMSDKNPLMAFFNINDSGKVHGKLMEDLDDFMQRRNDVAHAIAMTSSSGSDQLLKDSKFLRALGDAMCVTLEELAPLPWASQPLTGNITGSEVISAVAIAADEDTVLIPEEDNEPVASESEQSIP